jgi:branched-chain amino acid transport system substrate-binding protein
MNHKRTFVSLLMLTIGITACESIAGIKDKTLSREPIRIGMPAALSGPSGELGIQMKRGIDAWFKQVNEKQGGISGTRPLLLVPADDKYTPADATAAIKGLLDIQGNMLPNNCATSLQLPDCVVDKPDTLGPNRVLSILGQVGTPTMVVTAPVCLRNSVVYFAPFTGAQRFLRESSTTSNVIFNYRAGYYEETAAFVDYFFRTLSPPVSDFTHIIGFTQGDTYGDAGFNGFAIAYGTKIAAVAANQIKRINYTRGDLPSVDQSITDTKAFLQPLVDAEKAKATPTPFSIGVFMIPSYAPAAKYIKGVKDWINLDPERARLAKVVFMSVSFVGADALVKNLADSGTYVDIGDGMPKYYGDGVWVSQVVPYYRASLPGVVQYRQDIAAFDAGASTWGSLEGYVAARLFTEGLNRAATLDTPGMVKAYESIKDFDVGIGPKLNFDNALPEGHQASHTVWLSRIKLDAMTINGEFDVPWLWLGPVKNGNQIVPP